MRNLSRQQLSILFYLLLGSTTAYGRSGVQSPKVAQLQHTEHLERRVWYAPPAEINDIEQKVTAIIQKSPRSSFSFYLLSHLALRKFYANPLSPKYLALAMKHAEQSLRLNPKLSYGYAAIFDILKVMKSEEKSRVVLNVARQEMGVATFNSQWRLYLRWLQIHPQEKHQEQQITHLFKITPRVHRQQASELLIYMLSEANTRDSLSTSEKILTYYKKFQAPLLGFAYYTHLLTQKSYLKAEQVLTEIETQTPYINLALNAKVSRLELLILQNKHAQALKYAALLPSERPMGAPEELLQREKLAKIDLFLWKKDKHLALQLAMSMVEENTHNRESILKIIEIFEKSPHSSPWVRDLLHGWTQQNPSQSSLYLIAAEILMQQPHRLYAEAEQYYRQAILLNTSLPGAHSGLGVALIQQDLIAEAIQELKIAVKQNINDSIALYNLACAYALNKDVQNSIYYLAKAFTQQPSLRTHARTDSDLDFVRENHDFQQMVQEHPQTNRTSTY
ncbi:MAG: hypothetical protein OXT67_13285 [Zetaproteobacteria bacterium]|nr:hypothetical protein [Zetaproteobacteria bacterium]